MLFKGIRVALWLSVSLILALMPDRTIAQTTPTSGAVAKRFTAPDGRFSSDVPTWEDYMTVREQKAVDGADGYMVIWDDDQGGRLARIDVAKQSAMPASAQEHKQRIDELVRVTSEAYGIPGTAKLLESEYLPNVLGGAAYLSAFITKGSHVISEYEDGSERTPDAARTALLFFKGDHLVRVAFLVSMWNEKVPTQEQLDYLRYKTIELADSIVFAALPEFSGESQANWSLKADVSGLVSRLFGASHDCAVESIDTSVTRALGQGGAGSEELWVARGCKKEGRYRVALTPTSAGGAVVDVSEAAPEASETARTPASSRPAEGASMALTCIHNQTRNAVSFQFRWGETAAWNDASLNAGQIRPFTLALGAKGKDPRMNLEIRLGPSADPEEWPAFTFESKVAASQDCVKSSRTYLFAESGGQFYISEPE